ncbi:hypothetical protein FRC00_000155, partial [Tulasnella sp. 408]
MFKQRKNPRVIAWTQVYRRQHRKGVADQVQKKKTRKTVKSQRGYAGMSLADLAAKKAETPAARLAAREAAINKAKQEKKAAVSKDGKPKIGMAFTPDAELELLFDPALIPESAKADLPDDLHIRPLASTDLNRSQFDVLNVLTPSPKPTPEAYKSHFELLRSINTLTTSLGLPPTYLTLVIVTKGEDRIVATGS